MGESGYKGSETVMDLGEQQEFFSKLNLGVSKHYLDDSFTFIWGNTAFYTRVGYAEKEFLFRFPSLEKYGTLKSCSLKSMIKHFLAAFENGQDSTEFQIRIPVNHKSPSWFNVTCTFISAENGESPIAYLLYNDINDLAVSQKKSYFKEKEYRETFKWLMEEYAGNAYVSDINTYEILYLNQNSCNTLQRLEDEVLGRKCYEVIQGRNEPCPFCTNSRLEKNKTYEWEFYNSNLKRILMVKDRMIEWEGHKARIELSDDMNRLGMARVKKDLEKEAALKTLSAGMVRIDADDHHSMLWYNDKFLEMIEYTREQFEEEVLDRCTYLHPDDFKRASSVAMGLKKTGDKAVLEVRTYTRTKEERVWVVTLCYVSGEDSLDGIPSFYSIGLDVTNERKVSAKSERIIEKDSLTGVLNRAETERQIDEYILENPDQTGAFFMIDTDDFKSINDTKGHIVGDLVLVEMAGGMKKIMREHDIVGRVGGDEFIIFMKDIASLQNAEQKAEELLKMFQSLFENEKNSVTVTCSIGISIFPQDGENFKKLYAKADQTLYLVKSQGKNNYGVYRNILSDGEKDYKYFSSRTEIESEKNYEYGTDNLINYVFRTLYESNDLDQTINLILEIIGKQFDVSRAYIFENSDDNLYTSNTYEWCNKGINSEIVNLQNLSYSMYGDYEKLFAEDATFYCRDINTLKPEQRELFSEQGIYSTLQSAILEDEQLTGFIGFDECTGLRLWTQEEINLLSLVSQILSIFLQSKKVKKVKRNFQHYKTILNTLDDCIYVIEKESDFLLYKNIKFDEYYPEYEVGKRCCINPDEFHKIPIMWSRKEAFLCYFRY